MEKHRLKHLKIPTLFRQVKYYHCTQYKHISVFQKSYTVVYLTIVYLNTRTSLNNTENG